ncbi:MAG: hypothetical protein S4CHLAM20_04620 [Chlamydiia bacterium]|nr:hypothetical protein [Chlamydiia bacterium]
MDLVFLLFSRYVFCSDRNLIYAVRKIKISNKCDFNILANKIDSHPMVMDKKSSWKDYIYNIEKVYNVNAVKRKTIF